MSDISTIKIDDVEYVRKDSIPTFSESNIRIVILQRGNVMVGLWSQEDEMCQLTNAKVIRYWGTKNGLGEIANNGPTSTTKLDYVGLVQFHILTTVAIIHCNSEKW